MVWRTLWGCRQKKANRNNMLTYRLLGNVSVILTDLFNDYCSVIEYTLKDRCPTIFVPKPNTYKKAIIIIQTFQKATSPGRNEWSSRRKLGFTDPKRQKACNGVKHNGWKIGEITQMVFPTYVFAKVFYTIHEDMVLLYLTLSNIYDNGGAKYLIHLNGWSIYHYLLLAAHYNCYYNR